MGAAPVNLVELKAGFRGRRFCELSSTISVDRAKKSG